jgi:hypothetical protein
MSLSQSAFACGLRTGVCDDLKAEVCARLIESMGEDGVVVMEHAPVGMVRWYSFAQLLEGPGGSWMCRYIVNKPARSMFHDHQHVKQSDRRARDDAEVAGNDRLGVVL